MNADWRFIFIFIFNSIICYILYLLYSIYQNPLAKAFCLDYSCSLLIFHSHCPLKAFQIMLGLMAAASPILRLGLLHMRPIQFWLKQRVPSTAWRHGRHRVMVTRACVSALACWRDLFWLKPDVTLDTAHRRKVVTMDASNEGWGSLCEGKPTFGLWYERKSGLHINCLEMLAVCQACQFFLPDIRGHHVLVRSDSRSVVSYINHQGGLVSKRLCMLANDFLVWAQNNLRSLKAKHVLGKMNHGADMLSRNNVSSGE